VSGVRKYDRDFIVASLILQGNTAIMVWHEFCKIIKTNLHVIVMERFLFVFSNGYVNFRQSRIIMNFFTGQEGSKWFHI
jgi:hypothetical protein